MKKQHYVYILKCSDSTYYTGYTSDLENRLEVHNLGKGAKYTRGRLPVEMLWSKKCKNQRYAMRAEINIKALPKDAKEKLIAGVRLENIFRKYGRKLKPLSGKA